MDLRNISASDRRIIVVALTRMAVLSDESIDVRARAEELANRIEAAGE